MAKQKLQRARVIRLISGEIRRFIRKDEFGMIDDLLAHGVGWISNSKSHTVDDLGRALIALLPLAIVRDLEHVADSTICHRERLKGMRDEVASETARRVLAPLGVRYAACGCLGAYAGDRCCNNAVDATRAA